MKIRTATITFHSAHNYGSMLQAFALQQSLLKLGYDNEIINLRTERQKKIYSKYCQIPITGLSSIFKRIYVFPFHKNLLRKYELFEKFLSDDLILTQEYKSCEELKIADFSYDCFISGGDQIWNTSPEDFDWSFYLPFVKKGKRISYAVSMGPMAEKQVGQKDKIKAYLSEYNHISVREEGTASLISQIVNQPVSLELDPALLLTQKEWERKISAEPLIKGNYILLYSPSYKKSVYDMAKFVSSKLKMKVVVTNFSKHFYSYPFEKYLETGPWEFLNLTKNAALVISGSFHALVFATLFHTPFYAVNGDKDNRMITFLKNLKLQDRTINFADYTKKIENALITDYSEADNYLDLRREESLAYLKNSIEN